MSDHASPWSTPRTAPVRQRAPRTRTVVLDRVGPVRTLDWWLQGAVFGLVVLGALLVWSATKPSQVAQHLDPAAFLKKDILNVAIGLVLGGVAARVDYRSLRAYAPIVYGLSIIGLLAVLSPLGSTVNGAHSWIILPAGFQIQPAEFAKVALIVGAAMILGEKRDGETAPRSSDVLLMLGFAAVPMALIMGQPDFGTMMVFVFILLGMIAVSGAPKKWTIGLITGGVLFGAVIIQFHLLAPYQEDRLTSFAKSNQNLTSSAYTVDQGKTAIGAGGIFGQGLFHGSQTNGGYIPEQQTDFIFTAAGEELGFVGSGLILLLLGTVLWRGTRIAAAADDTFGMLVAAGVVSWFAFQGFINIGMTMGIMPVTGLPLMFVSYGGSSMFANMIGIGLLQNVHARSGRAS
jgi:rod shape determining protein RodA